MDTKTSTTSTHSEGLREARRALLGLGQAMNLLGPPEDGERNSESEGRRAIWEAVGDLSNAIGLLEDAIDLDKKRAEGRDLAANVDP